MTQTQAETTTPDSAATTQTAEQVVAGLTLEEKAALTSGRDFWTTVPVERLGLPPLLMTDGPHGLRLQKAEADHLGIADSVPATCFPPAVALGSSFDPKLAEHVGAAIAREALAEGVSVVLGPGINIKRSLLCGRNFEYFSEDPYISGVMGAALVRGQQGAGVGSSLKHFAANNQEHDRMRVSADVDERPLREIYLRAFQHVVTTEQPWTVMCSYNKVNGVYASQNPWLLNTVLRDEWDFEGLVVSDWGAVDDRVLGLPAGLDLEMPSSNGASPAAVVAAVRQGRLDEAALDTAATRVVELVQKGMAHAVPGETWDVQEHHALARTVAAASVVLLKNDGGLLPLAAGASVAVVGELARSPRYQGAGSSQINPTRLDNAVDELTALGVDVTFAAGYAADGAGSDGLTSAAVEAARAADVAVVFLGVPASQESEGFDREHLELPTAQLELLDAVLEANPRTVVVLSNGGVVRLSGFADRVPAILEGWLLGQAGGGAIADVLTGRVNPSGRLTETIPVRLEDSPAFLDFPGEHGHVRYGEGLFVGYRWYDARKLAVSFPFGHGLSYTTFEHSGLQVTADENGLLARLTVTNTGQRDGHEVVQAYVGLPGSPTVRAARELKEFAKVWVPAGQSRDVELRVGFDDLAYWETRVGRWVVEGGEYVVQTGVSSRDLSQQATVAVAGDELQVPLGMDATLGEVLDTPVGRQVVMSALEESGRTAALAADPAMMQMLSSFPLARLGAFGADLDRAGVEQLVAAINATRPGTDVDAG